MTKPKYSKFSFGPNMQVQYTEHLSYKEYVVFTFFLPFMEVEDIRFCLGGMKLQLNRKEPLVLGQFM